jgi:DNA topoisomerase-3
MGCLENLNYEILAKNYLAMLCEDYCYKHQTGHLQDYPTFKGSANQMTSMGYKLIYNDPTDDEDDTDGKLLGDMASPFIHEGFPPKPPTPTVKWLMKQLEKRDIGTGATRTSTFAEVSNDKSADSLIKESKGKITLTEKGQMSYLILPNTHIGSLEITEKVFSDMKAIAEGKLNAEQCLTEVKQLVLDDIETMKSNMTNLRAQFPSLGNRGVEKDTVTGLYKPQNIEITFNRAFSGHTFTDDEVARLLAGEEISFEATSSAGRPYNAVGSLQAQAFKGHKFWGFALKQSDCPPDKVEGVYAPKRKTIRFKKEWGGHTFTDAEIKELLAGKTISFPAVSKGGSTYTAKGKLAEQTYNGTKFWGFKADFK